MSNTRIMASVSPAAGRRTSNDEHGDYTNDPGASGGGGPATRTDAKGKHEFPTFDVLNKLRMQLQKVQYGEAEDKHGWMAEVSC